jgi:hypothetical protein
MHTPAKGSPVFRRTRRMSPTFADSGLVREKRFVRALVGSRVVIWDAVKALMGSLQAAATEGGGGITFIFLGTVIELESVEEIIVEGMGSPRGKFSETGAAGLACRYVVNDREATFCCLESLSNDFQQANGLRVGVVEAML